MVIDASAAFDALTALPRGDAVVTRLSEVRGPLRAPATIDIEVLGYVKSGVRRGALLEIEAMTAMDNLRALVPNPVPVRPLLERVWALGATLSLEDATYVALAEALEAPLLTTDARLARGAVAVSDVDVICIEG